MAGLGLNKNEAKVYLTLLRSAPTSIRQAAANSGVNRGTTYEAVKKLVAVGLVSYKITGSRTKYSAENPEKLQQMIKDRQNELANLETEAGKLMPRLMAFSDRAADAPTVRFYEDDEGIANILRDVLVTAVSLEKKEYYVYSSRALRQYLYRQFPSFTKRRIREKIFVKVIAIGTGGDPAAMSDRKFIAESDKEISSSYNIIYGNKVAMISVSKGLTPYGVVIEESGVAAMQRLLFARLWDSL